MAKPMFVLVLGATGHQGGATTRALLKKGHRVRALTRNSDSPAAQALKSLGAEIFQGNYDDPQSLQRAMQDVDGIFAMTTPLEKGASLETHQGTAIAEAAKTVDVPHLVFSSVACANRNTGIPYFDSKFEVEQHIQTLELPYTIIGPVFFMENYLGDDALAGLSQGKLSLPMPPTRTLQKIAVGDIGKFAAYAFENRDKMLGRRIDIAGDELTGIEAAHVLSQECGRKIEYIQQPLEPMEKTNPDFAKMFRWFDEVGTNVSLFELHRTYPEIAWRTFKQWAAAQDWKNLLKKAAA